MRRRKNSTGIGALSGIPLLVHAIPHEIYGHLERLRTTIDLGLFALWESLLSEEEHDQWSRWRAEQGELSPPIFQKLDRLILKQAETFGWRLMLSNLVQLRFRAWEIENNGPNLFEQLGLVLAKAVRVLQRRQLPSLDDPGLYDYKRAAVRELRAALHHFRVAARNAASVEQAIQAFRRIVSESHEFPLLQMNLESWLQFFRKTKARSIC